MPETCGSLYSLPNRLAIAREQVEGQVMSERKASMFHLGGSQSNLRYWLDEPDCASTGVYLPPPEDMRVTCIVSERPQGVPNDHRSSSC
jgi:hypothetical protein